MRHRRIAPTLAALIATALLVATAGCTGMGQNGSSQPQGQTEQIYRKHAGEPIERIRYTGFLQDWQPVGREAVLLSMARNRYYLVDLGPGCHLEARSNETLGLDTAISNQLSRFDRIVFRDAYCQIDEIRPLDYEAARAEIRALRDSETASGPAG